MSMTWKVDRRLKNSHTEYILALFLNHHERLIEFASFWVSE